MCLGVPAKVIEIKENKALIDYGGIRKYVDTLLAPDVKPGDYVIVHAGAIISIIDEEYYNEIVETFNEFVKTLREDEVRGIF